MFKLIKVQGESMSPLLEEGDFVFISRWYRKLMIGHLVVVDHALYGYIVKRVLHIAPDGQLWLGGENNKSMQSEKIGWVSPRRVIGKVITSIRSSRPTKSV
ncbi:nickel-type superoxide dismutase maturation protease [Marinomonas sp. C2222]|uniref:Nickel-type superoxide dismutase maturation protease n=1 Tax=Marinomonas sargassi TaxID=2984494 RepID=A0ABT2YTY7_9GAMM|nr:nickel-type superoxide dismutase maturation protease [Marinomonas sargassi]MCV2403352.1 nickel-type superoxide dismutase maturation protease [Marinomonas sargassi]